MISLGGEGRGEGEPHSILLKIAGNPYFQMEEALVSLLP